MTKKSDAPIRSWSISRVHDYEKCPYKAHLKYVAKVELTEEQRQRLMKYADRGSMIHLAGEHYITGERDDLIPEYKDFAVEMQALREMYRQGKVTCEEEWALDRQWAPTAWVGPDTWVRLKLDVCVQLSPTEMLVIDFKSGKKFGNEVKHNEQGQLYAIAAQAYHPEVDTVYVEFWYVDQDDMTQVEYGHKHLTQFKRTLYVRGNRLTTATQFPARANIFNCRYCEYNLNGTGHCELGVLNAPAPTPRKGK